MKSRPNIVLVDDPLSRQAAVDFLEGEGYHVKALSGGSFVARRLLVLIVDGSCELLLIDPLQVTSIEAAVINLFLREIPMIGYTTTYSSRGLNLVDSVGKDLGFKELLASIKRNTK